MPADDSLAHAIRLLEEGGFADAAARLRGSEGAPPQQKAAAPRRPLKRSDVELSATSSLESCGALSGPVVSTCPSQVISPTHSALPVAALAAAAPAARSATASAGHDDPYFSRMAVGNQVAFETQELMAVPAGARGMPKPTTPATYFHGGGPPSDLNLVPVTSTQTAGAHPVPTQLPLTLQRIVSPRSAPAAPSPLALPPSPPPSDRPRHLPRPLPIDTDTSGPPSHITTPHDSPPASAPRAVRVPPARHAHMSRGASGASSACADVGSFDGVLLWRGAPGSPLAGISPRRSLQGSTESLRGASRRSAGDDAFSMQGPCYTSDPPDATDDAAGFMTDISHSAWKCFTQHIAADAQPSSASSLNTARPAAHSSAPFDAATITTAVASTSAAPSAAFNASMHSFPSSHDVRAPPLPHPPPAPHEAAAAAPQVWSMPSAFTAASAPALEAAPDGLPPRPPTVSPPAALAAPPAAPRRSGSTSPGGESVGDAPLRSFPQAALFGSNVSRGTASSGALDSVSVFSQAATAAGARGSNFGKSDSAAARASRSTGAARSSVQQNPCDNPSSASSEASSSVLHGSRQREVSLMIDTHGYIAPSRRSDAWRGRVSGGAPPPATVDESPPAEEPQVQLSAHASCQSCEGEFAFGGGGGDSAFTAWRSRSAPALAAAGAAAADALALSAAVTAAVLPSAEDAACASPVSVLTADEPMEWPTLAAPRRSLGHGGRAAAGEVSFGAGMSGGAALLGPRGAPPPPVASVGSSSSSDPSFCGVDLRTAAAPPAAPPPAEGAPGSVRLSLSERPATAGDVAARSGGGGGGGLDVDLSAGSALACADSAEPMPFFASAATGPLEAPLRLLPPVEVPAAAPPPLAPHADSSPRPSPLFSWNSPPGGRMHICQRAPPRWPPPAPRAASDADGSTASLLDSSEPSAFDLPAAAAGSQGFPDLAPAPPAPRPRAPSADGAAFAAAADDDPAPPAPRHAPSVSRSCSGIDLAAALASPRLSWHSLAHAPSSPVAPPAAASPCSTVALHTSSSIAPATSGDFTTHSHSGFLPIDDQPPRAEPPPPAAADAAAPYHALRRAAAAAGSAGAATSSSPHSHSLRAADSGALTSHGTVSLATEAAALRGSTSRDSSGAANALPPDAKPRSSLAAALSDARRAAVGHSGPFATGTLHHGAPASPDWARVLLDGHSRVSSLHSSPAVSYRAISTHCSPSPALPLTDAAAAAAAAALDEHGNHYGEEPCVVFALPVYHRPHRTGLETLKEFKISVGDVIAERYTVTRHLGSAAFSRAVAAADGAAGGAPVCLKVIRSNKDFFDQSLDEIKLLKFVNGADPRDAAGVVRLLNFFYWREHLVIVTELLHLNLYQCVRRAADAGEAFFTLERVRAIAHQVLKSLAFVHRLGLIHCDLKPENIMIADFGEPRVKLIDLGSSCFARDRLTTYVQSRSYRAPEVVLRAKYDYKIDVWSLGCILAELLSGAVLFQNTSLATMLARIEALCGRLPSALLAASSHAHLYYTRSRQLYERDAASGAATLLRPVRSSLAAHLGAAATPGFVVFLEALLQPDPARRPTAEEALRHAWLCGGPL